MDRGGLFCATRYKEGQVTGLEALQSVQYVTAKGKRLAVIDADDWEALIEWLETLEDAQIAQQAYKGLETFRGDRERAGWLKWEGPVAELP